MIEMTISKLVSYKNEDGFVFTFEPVEDTLEITKTKNGFEARYLHYDEYADFSPREWENLGTMLCFHNRYALGDKHDLSSDDFSSWGEIREYLEKEHDIAVIIPLRLYDHSGITMSTSSSYPYNDVWDSGQVGYIYTTKEAIRKWYNIKRVTKEYIEKARQILEAEVEEYDKYLRGEVYSIVKEVYDEDKNLVDYDIVGGYLGYEYAMESLKTDF